MCWKPGCAVKIHCWSDSMFHLVLTTRVCIRHKDVLVTDLVKKSWEMRISFVKFQLLVLLTVSFVGILKLFKFYSIPKKIPSFLGVSLKKTLPKKNEECRVIMPLLNKVLYLLFLCRNHLVFLESSFWFIKQLVCYWKAQNISSDCLPVSMIKVTSDFLSCGIQKLGGLFEAFFPCVFFFFFSPLEVDPNSSDNQWRTLQQTLGSCPSGVTDTSDYFVQNW